MNTTDTRKRVRRQAAGNLMSNLFGGGGSSNSNAHTDSSNLGSGPLDHSHVDSSPAMTATGRKSTAQPRPSIKIPPRGIGPVYEPNHNDVLCGRGGRINAHSGNVQFRELVQDRKKDYLSEKTKKLEKAHIAAGIVQQIREMNPPGRFLKEDNDGSWYDIGDAKAIKKVGQALREDAPDIRHEINEDGTPIEQLATSGSPIKASTAVSGRGGAKAAYHGSANGDPSMDQYEAIAFQHIGSAPSEFPDSRVVPGSGGMRGIMPKNAAFSGPAAAAIMDHEGQYHHHLPQLHEDDVFAMPPARDIAFDRPFHVADHMQGDSSMISGMSGPTTVLSGMSGISGLTDPMSSISGRGGSGHSSQALRISQLNQLRAQWAAQRYPNSNSMTQSDFSARMLSTGGAGVGNSLNRSTSFPPAEGSHIGDMSWTDHSLIGGGIPRDDSVIGGGGSLLSGNYSTAMHSIAMESIGTFGTSQSNPRNNSNATTGQSSSSSKSTGSRSTSKMHGGGGGTTAMSIASGGGESLPSFQGSIMSDLSENLVALDLAESSRLLDQL